LYGDCLDLGSIFLQRRVEGGLLALGRVMDLELGCRKDPSGHVSMTHSRDPICSET